MGENEAPHPPADWLAQFSVATKAAAGVGYLKGYTDAQADVEARIWRARHVLNGKCRYCRSPIAADNTGKHMMRCQFYVGPLEHHWIWKRPNDTFGGIDHECLCGGYFRLGGIAGSGDGTPSAEPVCPNADQDWRGPRPEEVQRG